MFYYFCLFLYSVYLWKTMNHSRCSKLCLYQLLFRIIILCKHSLFFSCIVESGHCAFGSVRRRIKPEGRLAGLVKFMLLRFVRHQRHSVLLRGDVVVVMVTVWLLGCDCLCPVTPEGGVLWHAAGQFPCIYSSFQSRGFGVTS